MPKTIPSEKLEELNPYPLSYRLQQIRLLLGYTQDEAAKLIGCTQTSISTWETGKYPPCGKFLLKITEVYGLPSNYFMDLSVEKVKIRKNRKKHDNGDIEVIDLI